MFCKKESTCLNLFLNAAKSRLDYPLDRLFLQKKDIVYKVLIN